MVAPSTTISAELYIHSSSTIAVVSEPKLASKLPSRST
jgi:hypothetical protein